MTDRERERERERKRWGGRETDRERKRSGGRVTDRERWGGRVTDRERERWRERERESKSKYDNISRGEQLKVTTEGHMFIHCHPKCKFISESVIESADKKEEKMLCVASP